MTNATVSNQQTQTVSGQGPAQQPVPGSGAKAQRPAAQGSRRTSVPPGTKTAWQNTSRSSAGTPGSSLIPNGGEHYGLTVTKIGKDSKKLVEALESGKLVIAIMSAGHFTTTGHFIVLRGITEEGNVLVADVRPDRA